VHRARGDNYGFGAHRNGNVSDACLDTGRGASFDEHAAHVAIHDHARAALVPHPAGT